MIIMFILVAVLVTRTIIRRIVIIFLISKPATLMINMIIIRTLFKLSFVYDD